MKKKMNKKVVWKFTLSVVIFCGFICLAEDSVQVEGPPVNATYHEETDEYSVIRNRNIDIISSFEISEKGETDFFRNWHGRVTETCRQKFLYDNEWRVRWKQEGTYTHGYKDGRWILTQNYDPEQKWTYCYNMGKIVGRKEGHVECDEVKSVHFLMEFSTAFEILESKYPCYILALTGFGIEEEDVKAYLDTIETRLIKLDFDETLFNDKYDKVVGDLEYSTLDTVWKVHDEEAYYQGFYYLKFAEFRMAVVDAYRTGENNTYKTVSTTYPNFVSSLYSIYEGGDSLYSQNSTLIDSMFQIFFTDFDSQMASYGSLDMQDPFYIDSIDIRMLNSLVNIYLADEQSSAVASEIKNAKLNTRINSISSLRKAAIPVLEQIEIDSVSPGLVPLILYSMQPWFYEGDKIRQAVKEAYYLKKGIVTVPVATTRFLENQSSSSVQIIGTVYEDGGADVTERGIAWAEFYNPTVADNMESSGTGVGEFTVVLDELSPGTTYYARSYAKNDAGIAYGNCIEFTAGTTDIIEINEKEINFTVYPNPASQEINVDFCLESAETIELMIVNMQGQIVLHNEYDGLLPGQNQIKIDLSGFTSGIFDCKIIWKDKEINKKFLKIKE